MKQIRPEQHESIFIESVAVSGLFGKYKYRLPEGKNKLDPRLFILYGDNGSGKTTILFLLHHMLSQSIDRGHKTAIARIPFEQVIVSFSNGNSLRAYRGDGARQDFRLEVFRGSESVAGRLYAPAEEGLIPVAKSKQDIREESALLSAYEQLIGLRSYTLTDDRQLDSDQLADAYEREAEVSGEGDGIWLSPYRRLGLDTALSDSQLAVAIERADEWAASQSRADTNSGTTNVNSIYLDLLRRISHERSKEGRSTPDEIRAALVRKVQYLSKQMKRHVQFGLEPDLPSEALLEQIHSVTDRDVELAAHVLGPYLDGVKARLDAQQDTVHTISSFIDTLNQYYQGKGKRIHYDTDTGFMVIDEEGEYMSTQVLSSGERQILTIFCNVIAARRSPCLFLIDEPEISLNIKWQRRLVASLLECTLNSGIQLGLASHSFELLSAHSGNVVSLRQDKVGIDD